MTLYLPIAGVPVNVLLVLALGGGVGLLSGLFGVGGGFLLTPLLILIGIPAPVAVATGASQIVGTSFSGFLSHLRRRTLDIPMGLVLLAGGLAGSGAGVAAFAALRRSGHIDVVVSLAYVLLLGIVGALMLAESLRATFRTPSRWARARRTPRWIDRLPLRMRFPASDLSISAIPPLLVGAVVGMLTAIMGVGGGFIMVPAMIYLLGMTTNVVVGTSLFQIMFVTASTTFLQAVANRSVDVVLALLLLLGGVVGTQIGVRLGPRLGAEQLRILLALLVLLVSLRLGIDLVRPPAEPFSVRELG